MSTNLSIDEIRQVVAAAGWRWRDDDKYGPMVFRPSAPGAGSEWWAPSELPLDTDPALVAARAHLADVAFHRTELRVLRHGRDDEQFLAAVAERLALVTAERDQARHDLGLAEHKIRQLENDPCPTSWT